MKKGKKARQKSKKGEKNECSNIEIMKKYPTKLVEINLNILIVIIVNILSSLVKV